MRSYVVEEPFYPRQAASSPILTGVESVPQLAGYVATTPKPAGRVILTTHQDDPLLVSWQYGLGRAVAWTSDATGRWAQRWVEWDGFSRFWAQAVRWTILDRSAVPVEVAVALEGEQARVTVDAVEEDGAFVNGLDASVTVVGPAGEPVRVQLAQTAPGRYEGAFVPQAQGAYLMRLSASPPAGGGLEGGEDALALTTGWVMGYSPEYAALEGDPAYLAGLAELGGGAVLVEPADVLVHDLKGAGVRRDLWPWLLGLAALLLPIDVGVRRLALGRRDLERARAWVVARLPRRRPRPVAEAPSPVGRLFEAKSRAGERRPGGQVSASDAAPAELEVEEHPVPAPPQQVPSPVSRERAEPGAEGAAEGGTLAGRLLKRRREREEGD
jgi:Ca-activated chloride channel family protein